MCYSLADRASSRIHKETVNFQPCAFLFITLLLQGLMGVTTLGGLWVTTLTYGDLQFFFLSNLSVANTSFL